MGPVIMGQVCNVTTPPLSSPWNQLTVLLVAQKQTNKQTSKVIGPSGYLGAVEVLKTRLSPVVIC